MASNKSQKAVEIKNIYTIFVDGADFTTDKLEDNGDVNKLIEDTLEKQIAVLKLNQMDQDELRTLVQL